MIYGRPGSPPRFGLSSEMLGILICLMTHCLKPSRVRPIATPSFFSIIYLLSKFSASASEVKRVEVCFSTTCSKNIFLSHCLSPGNVLYKATKSG